jgi:hypothetical protein
VKLCILAGCHYRRNLTQIYGMVTSFIIQCGDQAENENGIDKELEEGTVFHNFLEA